VGTQWENINEDFLTKERFNALDLFATLVAEMGADFSTLPQHLDDPSFVERLHASLIVHVEDKGPLDELTKTRQKVMATQEYLQELEAKHLATLSKEEAQAYNDLHHPKPAPKSASKKRARKSTPASESAKDDGTDSDTSPPEPSRKRQKGKAAAAATVEDLSSPEPEAPATPCPPATCTGPICIVAFS
jgi:hypothetical protein